MSSTIRAWRSARWAAQPIAQRSLGFVAEAQRGRTRRRRSFGFTDRRQVDEPRAVGEIAQPALRALQRQARLAATADAGERQQPGLRQQPFEIGQRGRRADEARALLRQVVRRLRRSRRSGRPMARRWVERRGELVAPPGHGGDHVRTEQLAQAADLRGDVVLLHHDPGPDQVEQFLLGDQPFAPLGQRQQQVEGACTHGGGLALHAHEPLGRAYLKTAEAQRVGSGRRHGGTC